jgi:hypothetical protein
VLSGFQFHPDDLRRMPPQMRPVVATHLFAGVSCGLDTSAHTHGRGGDGSAAQRALNFLWGAAGHHDLRRAGICAPSKVYNVMAASGATAGCSCSPRFLTLETITLSDPSDPVGAR